MTRVSALVATSRARRRWWPFLAWQLDTLLEADIDEVVVASADFRDAIELEELLPAPWYSRVAWLHVPPGPAEVARKRNRLLWGAEGDFVCWIDDDDWHHPLWLPMGIEQLTHTSDTWVMYRGLRYVDLTTRVTWTAKVWERSPSLGTLVALREAALAVEPFDETLERGSDTVWKRALWERGSGLIVDRDPRGQPLIVATRHGENMSTWLHRKNVVPRNATPAHTLPSLYHPEVPREHWDAYFRHLEAIRHDTT